MDQTVNRPFFFFFSLFFFSLLCFFSFPPWRKQLTRRKSSNSPLPLAARHETAISDT